RRLCAEKSKCVTGRYRGREAAPDGCPAGDRRRQLYKTASQGATVGARDVRGRERHEHRHCGDRAWLWRVLAKRMVFLRPRCTHRARIEDGRKARRLHPYRHGIQAERGPAAAGAVGYRDAVLVVPHPEERGTRVSKDEATVGPHGSRRRKRLLTMRFLSSTPRQAVV